MKIARQGTDEFDNSFEYSNEYSTSSESKMFTTESSLEAQLFTFSTKIKFGKITEAPPATTAKLVSIEKLRIKHYDNLKDSMEHPKHFSYYEPFSTSTEINLTVQNKVRLNGTQQLKSAENGTRRAETRLSKLSLERCTTIKNSRDLGRLPLTHLKLTTHPEEILELAHNNANSIDAYSSKFLAIVPSTVKPIRYAAIENYGNFEKSHNISKLVDILLPPRAEKHSQKNKIVEKPNHFGKDYIHQVKHRTNPFYNKTHIYPQDLKMNWNLGCATTVDTHTETT